MDDSDNDGVYELNVPLPNGTYEYKFTLDGWAQQESFSDGDPCTTTIDGFVNRTLTVDGDEDWTKHIGAYFTPQCKLKIGNYQQSGIVHYVTKNFLTNDMIKHYEDTVIND